MRVQRYIMQNGVPTSENRILAWLQWMRENSDLIKVTKVGRVVVRTVFVGWGHESRTVRPYLFNTTISGDKKRQRIYRYKALDDAREGHARVVEKLRKQNGKTIIAML